MTKECHHCKQVLPLDEFHVRRLSKDGHSHLCKACSKVKSREQYLKHIDSRKAKGRIYHVKNAAKIRARANVWYYANRERAIAKRKAYAAANKPARLQRLKERFKSEPNYRIAVLTRTRIHAFIKGAMKKTGSAVLLGAPVETVREYLEAKFQPGMSWENHGKRGWHIDHIRPCASFDLSDPEQQKQCFHYTNLQPMWWRDNLSKCAKWAA